MFPDMEGSRIQRNENLKANMCARKLNYNLPLLSTKRLAIGLSNGADMVSSNDEVGTGQSKIVSERIPFSWEQAAGKPKEMKRTSDHDHDEGTPRPRLPPARWHEEMALHALHEQDYQNGCDGDIDDDDDDVVGTDDIFTDAVDEFSLSDALDAVQKSEDVGEDEWLKSKLEDCGGDDPSPAYILNRFLPDATAVAVASSALQVSEGLDKQIGHCCSYGEACESWELRHSHETSSKACGLELMFPWSIKHKLCGGKSPIQPCCPTPHLHPSKAKAKAKHRRLYSSSPYK